jgi:hypothetical protein
MLLHDELTTTTFCTKKLYTPIFFSDACQMHACSSSFYINNHHINSTLIFILNQSVTLCLPYICAFILYLGASCDDSEISEISRLIRKEGKGEKQFGFCFSLCGSCDTVTTQSDHTTPHELLTTPPHHFILSPQTRKRFASATIPYIYYCCCLHYQQHHDDC